ncbi:MAG: hypothetical protein ACP5QG_08705 [candidate division WOR-3 bacterium]
MSQERAFTWSPGKRVLVVLREGLPEEYMDEALYFASATGAEDADFFHAREGEALEGLLDVANRGFYGSVVFPPRNFSIGNRLGGRHIYQELFDRLNTPVLLPRGSFPYARIALVGGGHGIDDLARATGAEIVSLPKELEHKDLLVLYRRKGTGHSFFSPDKALVLAGTSEVSVLVVPV